MLSSNTKTQKQFLIKVAFMYLKKWTEMLQMLCLKFFFLCRIDMLHHSGFMTVKSRCILGLWQVQRMVDGTRVEVNLIRTRFPETWILRDRKINQDRTWQTENTTNNKKGPVSFFYLPKKKCSLQVLELMFIQKQEQVLIWEPSTNSTHA